VLQDEGLTDVELLCVATNATSWDQRDPGFEQVTYPILLDTAGVFYMYGAESYDIILVDKLGRLVTKVSYDESLFNEILQRIRELHAE
jgi:hypothetical protein